MKMLSLTQPVNWVQQTVYAWFFRVKTTALKVVIVLGILIILLWLSTFFYGTFYYVYMPPLSHTKPVHLQFRSDCDMRESLCSFPSANVTFGKIGDPQMLMPGQPYKVHVEIEMPESEVNQNLGMFMVIINFYSKDGEVVKSSHRSVMLRYRSLLLRKLRTFCYAPLMLLDTMEEKQLQRVELFDRYLDDAYKPAHGAYIEVQSKHIHIYSAVLVVHAYFTGVRYILFNYPIFSAVFGISFNMTFLSMIALLSWYQFLWQRESQQVVTRIGFEASSFELRRSATRERLNRDRHQFSIPTNMYRYDGGEQRRQLRVPELVAEAAQRHAVSEGMGSSEPPRSRGSGSEGMGSSEPPCSRGSGSEGMGSSEPPCSRGSGSEDSDGGGRVVQFLLHEEEMLSALREYDAAQGHELQGHELQGHELQGEELQGHELQGQELQGHNGGDVPQGHDDAAAAEADMELRHRRVQS